MALNKQDGLRESLKTVWKGLNCTHVSPLVSPEDNVHVEPPRVSAWAGLAAALHVLERGATACPPLKSAFGGVIGCLDVVQTALKNREDYEEVAAEFKTLAETLGEYAEELGLEGSSGSIARIAQSIKAESVQIAERQSHGNMRRMMESSQEQENIVKHYRKIETLFRRLQNDVNIRSWRTADKQYKMALLERLSPVDDARYDSSYSTTIRRRGCTAETREQVQAGIQSWIQNAESPNVYWMNGMAGTGKTTIAYSLCEWLETNPLLLGASFFCSRASSSCCDVNRIIPTIAAQLAQYSPAFRSALCKAIESNPAVGKLNVVRQIERLLRDPLLEADDTMLKGVVIVIDALDECEDSHAVRLMLDTLLRFAVDLPLKFFLASRPVPAVWDRMLAPGEDRPSVLHLHDIEQSMVENDIRKYLWESLGAMLPAPSESQIDQLARQSGKLFIYAATVVRYILPDKALANSTARLNNMLRANSTSAKEGGATRYKRLDELYGGILAAALEESLEASEAEAIKLVLGIAVCAKEPLAIQALTTLIGLDEQQISSALRPLQSVLHVSESSGLVSTLHASFTDYVLDQSRSGRFYCDALHYGGFLAERCLKLMESQLRFNICDLKSSFVLDRDVYDMGQRVKLAISPALFYACRYWGDHLQLATVSELLQSVLVDFFNYRLLFWMEVLNLKGCIGVSVPVLTQAQIWLSMHETSGCIVAQVTDARNFATMYAASSCSLSSCHLYISAIAFCPRESWVYQTYGGRISGGLMIGGSIVEDRKKSALATWITNSGVNAVGISPDGARIIVGLIDGTTWVRNGLTGEVIAGPFKGEEWTVYSVAFSPSSTHIVAGLDHAVRIWDYVTGNLVSDSFEEHDWTVNSVAYSHDGTRIVSGSRDGVIRVWDLSTHNHTLGPWEAHKEAINSVAFSPEGTYIASGSSDCTIMVWDSSTGEHAIGPFQGHTNQVNSVKFSPDGTRIVSGSSDGTVGVWDVQKVDLVVDLFRGHLESVNSVSFSPDSNRIVSGSSDQTIWIWDSVSGDAVAGPFQGHTSIVTSVVFSPDGTRVISGSWDGTIQVWDTDPSKMIFVPSQGHMGSISSAVFSSDGDRVVSGSWDGTIRVWDTHTGNNIASSFQQQIVPVNSVTLSPDGSCMVSGSRDGLVRRWDAHTGKPLGDPLEGHTQSVESVAFSPKGTCIASGSVDRSIRLWDVRTGTPVATSLYGHSGAIQSVAFSPDGARIVSGSSDETIRVWDTVTYQPIGSPFLNHTGPVNSVTFSPDGNRIASGSQDRTIRVWDSRTGAPVIDALKGHWQGVCSVTFSSDGTRIISGSEDYTIRVWEANTGDFIAELFQGHIDAINSVAVSPDGSRIVSCSDDKTIRLWDVRNVELPVSVAQVDGNDREIHGFALDSSDNPPEPNDGSNDPPEAGAVDVRRRAEQLHALDDRWKFSPDGWITSVKGPLFWVPPNLHRLFPRYPGLVAIFPHGSVAVDYQSLLLGERWSKCYVSE